MRTHSDVVRFFGQGKLHLITRSLRTNEKKKKLKNKRKAKEKQNGTFCRFNCLPCAKQCNSTPTYIYYGLLILFRMAIGGREKKSISSSTTVSLNETP